MDIFYADVHEAAGSGNMEKPGRAVSSRFARALLFHALYDLYGIKTTEIAKHDGGKPYFPHLPGLYFSLSHSGSLVFCAISGRDVGADVECIRQVRPGLFERISSEDERRDFSLFEFWTLRESLYKLTGKPGLNGRFIREGEAIIPPLDTAFCRVYHDIPGAVAAVCGYEQNLPDHITKIDATLLE